MKIITIPSTTGNTVQESVAPGLDDKRELVTIIKDDCNRRELGHGIRYFKSGKEIETSGTLSSRVIADCFQNCVIFLVHGSFGVDGPIKYTNTSYAYRVQGEAWVRLYGHTTILVIEDENAMEACQKAAEELRAKHLEEQRRAQKPLSKLKKQISRILRLQ